MMYVCMRLDRVVCLCERWSKCMRERGREGGGKRGEGRDGRGKIEERRRQGRERRVIQSESCTVFIAALLTLLDTV